ncbi:hypothetical protein [Pontiella sp.]|uniref:hypothetical protein n=1 Tax=Pontiella sp. TaxID=2837462 RepID=UPI00356A10B7
MINITAAWIGFALGAVSGAIPGLFFHRQDWLGGYTSWPRRLIRLGHISFFGISFLNLGLGLTGLALGIDPGVSSILMIVGAVMMPTVCYLSAFKPAFRHLFFIPAGAVLISILLFIFNVDGASSSAVHPKPAPPAKIMEQDAPSTFQKGATP